MFTIPKSATSLSKDKKSLITEASDAGFGVGNWPDIVAVLDEKNEGFLFFKERAMTDPCGEFGGYEYRTKSGDFGLTVFND
jgi:hypothetical protein